MEDFVETDTLILDILLMDEEGPNNFEKPRITITVDKRTQAIVAFDISTNKTDEC